MGCCLCFSPSPPHRPLTVQSVRTSSSSSGSGVASCRRLDSPSADRTTCSSALCLFFYYSVTHFETPVLPSILPHLFFLQIQTFHRKPSILLSPERPTYFLSPEENTQSLHFSLNQFMIFFFKRHLKSIVKLLNVMCYML